MQVLATEHCSLLATRSLTYSEIFSRVTMFLAILSGSVIALALIAQADHFGPTFVSIAILILSVVLFVGITTFARLMALNRDDIRWVTGMNRLRRAYLERHPELEPYFVAGSYDDLRSLLLTMGVVDVTPGRPGFRSAFHGLQTMPGTLAVIVGAVAAALVALITVALSVPELLVVLAAGVAFALFVVVLAMWGQRSFSAYTASL